MKTNVCLFLNRNIIFNANLSHLIENKRKLSQDFFFQKKYYTVLYDMNILIQ